jgi:hypothetical protein
MSATQLDQKVPAYAVRWLDTAGVLQTTYFRTQEEADRFMDKPHDEVMDVNGWFETNVHEGELS